MWYLFYPFKLGDDRFYIQLVRWGILWCCFSLGCVPYFTFYVHIRKYCFILLGLAVREDLNTESLNFQSKIFIFVCVDMHMTWGMCGVQRTTSWVHFSSLTFMWLNLGSQACMVSALHAKLSPWSQPPPPTCVQVLKLVYGSPSWSQTWPLAFSSLVLRLLVCTNKLVSWFSPLFWDVVLG